MRKQMLAAMLIATAVLAGCSSDTQNMKQTSNQTEVEATTEDNKQNTEEGATSEVENNNSEGDDSGMSVPVRPSITEISQAASSAGKDESGEPEEAVEPWVKHEITRNPHELAPATPLKNEGIEVPVYDISIKETPDNEAIQFVKDMGTGWNLGNTFDACTDGLGGSLALEASWVGVYTTQEMIDAVKAAGFNTIRIPVSWHNHVSGPDFTIDQKWLDRVEEVVQYAYDDDLYIILNIHHDVEQYNYYPDEAHYDNSEKYMISIWNQLSERFEGFDNHLIFESINEPRLKGTSIEWWMQPGDKQGAASVAVINRLNQVFVDTVRASGGNNADRYLMIPGYDTSVDNVIRDDFSLPEDTTDNRLIVTTHAYTPYNFALNLSGTSRFDKSGEGEIDYIMNALYDKYVSNGIPVVMGEYGAVDKDNLQDRVNFTSYYISKAKENSVMCIYWDNNAYVGSGENFGLLNRGEMTWPYSEILDAIMCNK